GPVSLIPSWLARGPSPSQVDIPWVRCYSRAVMGSASIRDELRTFICCELLGRPDYPLQDDEPLISGGLMDSFSLAYVAVFFEERFRVFVPDVELTVENFDTLAQMVARVEAG